MANQKTKTSQKLNDIRLFYVTTPNIKVARHISKILIQEKLIACSNILPVMESHYVWKGKIEKSKEAVLILKSAKRLAKALTARVLELHPYDVPCVIELPVEAVSEAYGLWLHSQLK